MVKLYPQLIPLPTERRYMLDGPSPQGVAWWVKVDGQTINLPHEFRTDGASVPRVLWPVIGSPFDPRVIGAALVHDYLYTSQNWRTRAWSDMAFRALLIQDCTPAWKAWIMWLGVRVFGWRYWRINTGNRAR